MSDEEKKRAAAAARDAQIDRIFDLSLALALERLDTIEPKEKKDSLTFDRVARTAQSLVRLADEADTLAARKRKEQSDHDKNSADAGDSERIARDAAVLQRELDRHIDEYVRRGFAPAGEGDVAAHGAGAGDRT